MTGDALAASLAAEEVHTQDGLLANGVRVTVHELIVGELSATRVASYSWMARPKKSEKLYCVTVYSLAASATEGGSITVGVPSVPMRITLGESHQ